MPRVIAVNRCVTTQQDHITVSVLMVMNSTVMVTHVQVGSLTLHAAALF